MKPVKVPTNNTIERKPRKLQYYIEDPEHVIDDFERFVRINYGFTKGIIGFELLKALSFYMYKHGFEHYSDIDVDTLVESSLAHKPPLTDNKLLLKGYLGDNYFSGNKITFRDLQDIIIEEYGRTDRRTHKAYVDTLEVNEILCRCPGIDRYDYYYFKEIPSLSPVEELSGDLGILYSHFPVTGSVRIEKLERLSGWSRDKLAGHIRQLEKDGLIKSPTPGVFKLIEMEGE